MNVRCPLSILIECSKCLLAAASSSNWDDRSLFRNDRIALSVNSRGKSSRVPYRYSIAKQSSAQRCWSVMACWASHAVSHPKQSNGFRSGDLNISEVIFKRRRRRTACIGSAAAARRSASVGGGGGASSVRIIWKPEYTGPPHLLRRPPHYSENPGYRGGRRRAAVGPSLLCKRDDYDLV